MELIKIQPNWTFTACWDGTLYKDAAKTQHWMWCGFTRGFTFCCVAQVGNDEVNVVN